MHTYHVYILTNVKRNVMYVGVTNKLENRVAEHGDGRGGAFTRRYQVKTPVYAEEYRYIDAREKEIKGLATLQKRCAGRGVEANLGGLA
jgi:putative endonuclease